MALTKAQLAKLKEINSDPVKWAQVFLVTYDKTLKKETPWTARWYQSQMIKDKSKKKVYRCGRRTGKSECMVVESLYNACNHKNYRVLLITPYENQIRLLFQRINELRSSSPLLNARVVSATKNPYKIEFDNGSLIMGFTTGASSGSSGASIRGQAADLLILDECDYMADGDFDSILMIAGERPDIRVIMSSTPTGKRGNFYKCCTDKTAGYTEHYHPSTHNPGWNDEMEAEFRAILSEQGYVHEVLAEFGSQELGVFDKQKLDKAIHMLDYAYNPLDYYQEKRCKEENRWPLELFYDAYNTAPPNVFRTMGVDWDKYGASSSLLILEFDTVLNRFKVLKRYEMPKAEYSYDNAVNKIIDDCVSKYKSVDFFLHRDEWRKYETFGRIHTEEESKKIDERILKELNKDFIHIDNNTSIDSIINKLDLEPNKLEKSIKPLDLNSYSEYEITNALNKLDYEKLVKTMILYEKSDDFKYGGFKYAEETLQIAYDKFLNDDNFTRIMSEEFSDIIDEAYEYVKEKNKEKQKEKIIPLKEKYPDR